MPGRADAGGVVTGVEVGVGVGVAVGVAVEVEVGVAVEVEVEVEVEVGSVGGRALTQAATCRKAAAWALRAS